MPAQQGHPYPPPGMPPPPPNYQYGGPDYQYGGPGAAARRHDPGQAPQAWNPPPPGAQPGAGQMASDGLASVKGVAAKLSVTAWLLYGGFVVALIATFCPAATVTYHLFGAALSSADVSFNGPARIVAFLVLAGAAWLAWPTISGAPVSVGRAAGLSVAVLLLIGLCLAWFVSVSSNNKGNSSTGVDVSPDSGCCSTRRPLSSSPWASASCGHVDQRRSNRPNKPGIAKDRVGGSRNCRPNIGFRATSGRRSHCGTRHFVRTHSPDLRCEVGSDDSDVIPGVPGMGPNVVCQTAGFPQSPMNPPPGPGWTGDPLVLHQDQAIITASGQFSWRTANLGMAPPGQPDTTLVNSQTYHLQGWTIAPTNEGIMFTNDATGHGMDISGDYSVKPF